MLFHDIREIGQGILQKRNSSLGFKVNAANDLRWRSNSVSSAANDKHVFDTCILERITKIWFSIVNGHHAHYEIGIEFLCEVVWHMVSDCRSRNAQSSSSQNDNKSIA